HIGDALRHDVQGELVPVDHDLLDRVVQAAERLLEGVVDLVEVPAVRLFGADHDAAAADEPAVAGGVTRAVDAEHALTGRARGRRLGGRTAGRAGWRLVDRHRTRDLRRFTGCWIAAGRCAHWASLTFATAPRCSRLRGSQARSSRSRLGLASSLL